LLFHFIIIFEMSSLNREENSSNTLMAIALCENAKTVPMLIRLLPLQSTFDDTKLLSSTLACNLALFYFPN
jgi:hypothetical protein